MNRFVLFSRFTVLTLAVSALTIGPSLLADGGAAHQVLNNNYGVSGGNVNDITKRFCCSGTLGSLVQVGTTQYILSNNHVLGRGDQAASGEDISQPGRIDNNCALPRLVADFTAAPLLGSNVDAAIAQLRPGTMNTSGAIEDIGSPSTVVQPATVGLSVAKSGRTTGFTTGSISSVTTSVNVQYQQNCGQGKKFVVSYTNQVVINSTTFSAGGDSGSLIVSNDSCHHPVALLFAGSSSSTIGNPIGEVLTKLSALVGPVTFVGSVCANSVPDQPISDGAQPGEPSSESVQRAVKAMRTRETDLMSRPGVLGVGVGASETGTNEASIVVYLDAATGASANVPKRINGVRVRKVFTDPFIAY
jgi:Peptidase family S64